MIRFKKEKHFNLFMETFNDLAKLTYQDVVRFAEDNNLEYGVACYNEDKDTLHIKTSHNECFIVSNGEAENIRGKYIKYVAEEDYETINSELNNDLEYIFGGKADVICVNEPFIKEKKTNTLKHLEYRPISVTMKRDYIAYQPCFLDIIKFKPKTKSEIDDKYHFGLDADIKETNDI